MISVFEPCSKQVPELYYLYKDAVRAMQERAEQMRLGGEKLHVRRMKQPNRYRCTTPGCGIEADTGTKLSQCMYHFHFLIPVLQSIDNVPYTYIRRWILRPRQKTSLLQQKMSKIRLEKPQTILSPRCRVLYHRHRRPRYYGQVGSKVKIRRPPRAGADARWVYEIPKFVDNES